jgi:hypothetical protein
MRHETNIYEACSVIFGTFMIENESFSVRFGEFMIAL